MSVLPELAPNAEVLGLVPATDNLPDGRRAETGGTSSGTSTARPSRS